MSLEHQHAKEFDHEHLAQLNDVLREYLDVSAERLAPGQSANARLSHNAQVYRREGGKIVEEILGRIEVEDEDRYVRTCRYVRESLLAYFDQAQERVCREHDIEQNDSNQKKMREAVDVFIFEIFARAQRQTIMDLRRANEAALDGWQGGLEDGGDPIEELVTDTRSSTFSIVGENDDQGPGWGRQDKQEDWM